jgi:RHS repeat-associated protein
MTRRTAVVALCFAAGLLAAYQYYYSADFAYGGIDPAKWHQNGNLWANSGLRSTDAYGGSLISTVAVPDGSQEYEVRAKLLLQGASRGAYIVYLSASLDALSGPWAVGSYYAIELQNPRWDGNNCSIDQVVYKRANGVVTQLAFAVVPCRDWSVFRVLRRGAYITAMLDGLLTLSLTDGDLAGQPGVGVRDTYPGGGSMWEANLGPVDRVAPAAVPTDSIASYPLPNSVDLQWQGATDGPDGVGVRNYEVHRNGAFLQFAPCCEFSDQAVSPGTSYTYTLYAMDLHLNYSLPTTVTVTTPPASTIDPRRVGVRPTGAYWGGAGERIDTRSGNLNYTLPLLRAMGRGGYGVSFALSYNSQLWRQDPGGTWKLGREVGYGFGWRLQAGSITPYWSDPWTIHHYVLIDSTGAEYRLDVNTNGIWTSREGLYLEYDAANQRLYFPDGSFWVMGAASAGTEQDAGTRYATLMQDTNGNQILIRYNAGVGAGWTNSSARIDEIEDVRAVDDGAGHYRTYKLTYNGDAVPHLTGIANYIGTSENYSFGYLTGQSLYSPFSPPVAFGTTDYLLYISISGLNLSHTFEYAGGAGELTKVTLPLGGSLRWAYRQFTYLGSRAFREVQYRYLRPSAGVSELTYQFVHDDAGDASRSFHSWTRLMDPSGHATGVSFQITTTPSYSIGLQTMLRIRPSATGTPLRRHEYTWSADAAGNPYISSVLTTLNEGQSYQKQSKTEQTLDTHGNVLQSKVYNYGNLTTPARTYNYTWLASSAYTSLHIWNRLLQSSVTNGTDTIQLVSQTYDGGTVADPPSSPPLRNWTQPGSVRGNVTSRTTPGLSTQLTYQASGDVATVTNNGLEVQVTPDTTKNYAVPAAATPNEETNLATSMTYSGFLGVTSVTGPNGASSGTAYDSYGRPSSSTSPHGAVTTYTYTYSPPTVKTTTNGRWTKTTLDGLGRTIHVEQGDGSGTKSIADTEYTACACSPFGKVWRVSPPYAPGGTVYWTTSTYDCLGRATTVALPGGTGSTTYLYQGNTTKVTDPAGKWKTFKTDAMSNLIQVTEPNPAGGANHETYYTYNLVNKLTQVSMPRGSTTQVRTFVYDSEQRLISATNPENGAVTYVYNSDSTLQKKTDAKGQRTDYSYDTYKRLTAVYRYNASGQPQDCQVALLFYDQNGWDPSFTQNSWGRLAWTEYRACDPQPMIFREMYSYTQGGLKTKKRLWVFITTGYVPLDGVWTYDNEGRMTSVSYPLNGGTYNHYYDSLGRPNRLSQGGADLVSGVTYGPAGELTAMNWGNATYSFHETRTYNSRLQLTRQTAQALVGSNWVTDVDLEYRFSPTQNNAQITQFKDWMTGEEVTYAYDSLIRLISASTTGPEWGQSYGYDGFGNRTSVTVTKGTAPAGNLTYDQMTNRITNTGFGYDANGNLTAMPGMTLAYDVANRVLSVSTDTSYAYDADNRRVWKASPGVIYFYGVEGRKLGTYRLISSTPPSFEALGTNLYFAGRLINSGGKWVATDRLGSVVKSESERLRYFPWGEEQVTTTQNREKFGTYFRDQGGLDYADQRYYSSQHGRFLTPDPYISSGGAANPQSWNQYPYVENDPVNFSDPRGLFRSIADTVTRYYDFYEVWSNETAYWDSAWRGGGEGGGGAPPAREEPRGGGAPPEREVDCSSEFPVAGMEERFKDAVPTLREAAGSDEALVVLAAFTWMEESTFRQNPPPNVNIGEGQTGAQAIAAGNVDIGPMQINYHWHIRDVGAAVLLLSSGPSIPPCRAVCRPHSTETSRGT